MRGPYYLLDDPSNMVVLVGCQARVDVRGGSNNTLISSCTVVCPSPDPSTTYIGAGDGSCSGVGCCQANIVLRYSRYTVQIHDLQEQDAPSSSPTFNDGSAYIVDQPFNYTGLMISEKNFPQALSAMLDWFIVGDNSTCPMSTNESAPAPASAAECRSVHSFCEGYYGDVSDDVVVGYRCRCSPGYQGNPYVKDGCYGMCLPSLFFFTELPENLRKFFFIPASQFLAVRCYVKICVKPVIYYNYSIVTISYNKMQ